MAQYDAGSIEATLNVNQDPFDEGLRMAQDKAKHFEDEGHDVDLGINLNDAKANEEIDRIRERLAELSDDGGFSLKVGADTEEARAEVDALRARLDELRNKTVKIKVEDENSSSVLNKIKKAADDASGDGGSGGGGEGHGGIAGLLAKFGLLGTLGAGLVNPLLGEVAGLGGAFAIAGIPVAGFGVLAKSAFTQMKTDTQAVTKAQQELTAATTNKEREKAILDLAAANAKLVGPEGQAAAAFEKLTKATSEFKKETGPATFGVLSSGMNMLSGILPKLVPLIDATGKGLQGVIGQLTKGFDGAGFEKFLDFLKTNVGPVLNSLTNTAIKIGGGLATGLENSMPVVSAVLGQLNHAGSALDKLTSSTQFKTFMSGLADDVKLLTPVLGSVFTLLGHLLQDIQPLVAPVLTVIEDIAHGLDALLPGLSAFTTALADGLAAIGPALPGVGKALGEVLTVLAPLLPPLGQLIGTLLPPLSKLLGDVAKAVQPLIAPLGHLVTALGPMLVSALSAVEPLVPIIGLLAKALAPVIDLLADVIKWLAPLAPLFIGLMNPVLGFAMVGAEIIKHWGAISGFFSKLWSAVSGFFTKNIKTITRVVEDFATLGGAEIIRNWGPISKFFSKLWSDIAGFFENHWKTILGVILDVILWPAAIVKHWDSISSFFSKLWSDIEHAFSTAWTAIGKSLDSAWDHIKSAVSSLGSSLENAFSKMWSAITKGISSAWSSISSFFEKLPGRILAFFSAAPGWLLNAGKNIIKGLVSGITTAASAIWSFFKGLPGDIKDLFSDAANWLYNIGKDIIKGLLNGLKDAWGDVTSWLGSAANGLTGVAKKAWSILSPSKVFHEIGMNLGIGLHNGIKESFAPIHGTLTDQVKMINDIVDGIGMNVAGSISVNTPMASGQLAAQTSAQATLALAKEVSKLHDTIKAAPDATGEATAAALKPVLTKVAKTQARTTVTAQRQNGSP